MLTFFIDGVKTEPTHEAQGVYEITIPKKNKLPRKMKNKLKLNNTHSITIINDWLK